MRIEKELSKVIKVLEEQEEVYTVTAHNKVLLESGSIIYNKKSNTFNIYSLIDTDIKDVALEELIYIIEE